MSEQLQIPVTEVKGIGNETANILSEMNIYTVLDLMEHFPYRYEDYSIKNIDQIKHDERATVQGTVQSEAVVRFYGKKKSRLSFRLLVDGYLLTVVMFNRHFFKKNIIIGANVTVTGKFDRHRLTITVDEIQFGEPKKEQQLVPIYSVKANLTVKSLQKLIHQSFIQFHEEIEETLPQEFIEKYKLFTKKQALLQMHRPKSQDHLKQARRRLVYEELLLFQLKMVALRKWNRENGKGIEHQFQMEDIVRFIQHLPFQLTEAQQRVVQEILADMQSPYKMHRLLQGDVGSGKTIVAAICLFASVKAGYQGALMVPTEILAEQHYESLERLLSPFHIQVALLTSSIKGKQRQEILHKLANNEIQIIIGTHSLIQEEVQFQTLSLVITDEQHRFGVEQRRILREKGEHPDVLFMTATPIPRTLALTAFGEMDVSTIDVMPSGRKEIETYWANHNMLERVLAFVYRELEKSHQAYVICPLIEDSDKLDVQNAIDVHQMLVHYFPPHIKVGLMHGRLHPKEKEEVMKKFAANEYQVLVSTTVVEVGVNVPNATVMVIYDADRFGLSQLHQLRGRVGRGDAQSYCILIADPKTDVGKERMRIMTETTNGFELSERDLELRGPGDFFGKKQSGLPEFKVADLVHDYRVLEVARQDAFQLISRKDFWEAESYAYLRNHLLASGIMQGEKLD